MIHTLLPPCQSWPPSYSSSSSLILHRGGETFSFFAKWICLHVFGRGEKLRPLLCLAEPCWKRPLPISQKASAQEGPGGQAWSARSEAARQAEGNPWATWGDNSSSRGLFQGYISSLHHPGSPTSSGAEAQILVSEFGLILLFLLSPWPTKTPRLPKPRGVLPT